MGCNPTVDVGLHPMERKQPTDYYTNKNIIVVCLWLLQAFGVIDSVGSINMR